MYPSSQFEVSERQDCFSADRSISLSNASLETVNWFGKCLSLALFLHPQVDSLYLYGPIRAGKTVIANAVIKEETGKELAVKSFVPRTKFIQGHRTIVYADLLKRHRNDPSLAMLNPLLPKMGEFLIAEHPQAFPVWMLAEHRIEIDIRPEENGLRNISVIGFNAGETAVECLGELLK